MQARNPMQSICVRGPPLRWYFFIIYVVNKWVQPKSRLLTVGGCFASKSRYPLGNSCDQHNFDFFCMKYFESMEQIDIASCIVFGTLEESAWKWGAQFGCRNYGFSLAICVFICVDVHCT